MKSYPLDEQRMWDLNMKTIGISTAQDPTRHGRLPFKLFDPGKSDPCRELHLVDADNRCVTTTGPLMDPTDMSLGNALFLLECVNSHEELCQKVVDLEMENNSIKLENSELTAKVSDLEKRLEDLMCEV